MYEVNEAAEMISRAVDSEAQIIFGASIDSNLNGKVRVTVLAAGFGTRGVTPAGAGHPISETFARKVTRAETEELGAA